MSNLSYTCTKAFVWVKRFRKRKGYGVHSPFAYNYIRQVIYGKLDSDTSQDLRRRQRIESRKMGKSWATAEHQSEKELLYRMVKHAQPQFIVNAGTPSAADIYLQYAWPQAHVSYANCADELAFADNTVIDFAYLHATDRPEFLRQAFERCAAQAGHKSVFAIHGIYSSNAMKMLWKELVAHSASGITFDLYDLGIIMFDKKLNKQDYIVNF